MKRSINITIILILFIAEINLDGQEKLQHHTGKGFRNPNPGFEERTFRDFVKWRWSEKERVDNSLEGANGLFEILNNDGAMLKSIDSLFTVTWIGHSTMLIQLEGMNILTDPIWSERASPFQFAGPKRYTPPGMKIEDLPEIDVILISHNHYDHCDKTTLKRLGNKPLYIVPLGLGKLLGRWGIENYLELDWWQEYEYKCKRFICLPAQHFSGRGFSDGNKSLWCGYAIKGERQSFCFIGDSGYFPGFKEIGEKYGPFDAAALPIGAFMPKWFMGPVHMNPDEALQALQDLKARIFIPHHYGCFKLASDPLNLPLQLLKESIISRRMSEKDFYILKIGESRKIEG